MTERALHPAWYWGVPAIALAGLAAVGLSGINTDLFLRFNALSAYTGEGLWAHVTILGDTSVALTLVLPFLWKRPDIVWALVIAALLSTLWVHGFKPLFDVARPPAVLPEAHFNVIGPDYRMGSFPSGHTTTAFTLAGLIGLSLARPAWLWLLAVAAALVGLSRAVVGIHWPLDILGGALGGWLSALIAVTLARRWPLGAGVVGQGIIGAILALTAIYLLVFHDTHYPHAVIMQRLIAIACLVWAAWHTVEHIRQRPASV